MSEEILKIENLSVTFRSGKNEIVAVKNVSINIAAGETVAVVGESGSGKSTTAAAVNGLLPENGQVTTGRIIFKGKTITDMSETALIQLRGAGIGLVPQDPMSNLNPLMRIGHQVGEALEVHGITTGSATRQQVIKLLGMVGIPDPERRANQYPYEFSGGMRQRALIAMGMACKPQLLIADEPTSALDATVQRQVLDQLDQLTDVMGTAVFLITHDLALAAERADRVVVMRNGEVVEQGKSGDVLQHPQDEYTKELLAAMPILAPKKEKSTDCDSALIPLLCVHG